MCLEITTDFSFCFVVVVVVVSKLQCETYLDCIDNIYCYVKLGEK